MNRLSANVRALARLAAWSATSIVLTAAETVTRARRAVRG